MAKEKNLTAVTSVAAADFARVVTSAGASVKATFANVAKYIIETYNGSTVAGSAQSVKRALDSLNSKTQATVNTDASIGGGCFYVKAGKMVVVTGGITVPSGTASSTVLVSGLPTAASGNMAIRACNNNAVQSYFDMIITSNGGLRMSVSPTSNVDLRFTFAYVAA